MKKRSLLTFAAFLSMLLGVLNIQAQCFTPLYPSGNLVSDPECTALTTYAGWGSRAVITDPAKVYCGTSCIGISNSCGGSLDYALTGKLTANTTYRLKAMVYSNKEVFINLDGCGINGTTATYQKMVNTGSTWQAVDFIFSTGTLGASQNFWFNSCSGGNRATDMRIDNFELYAYPDPVIVASSSFLPLEGVNSTATFTVTGANLTNAVTLAAPAGVTLSTTSIPANPKAVSVTATYDGTTSVNGYITLTSGTATASIRVKGYNCFSQLYPGVTNLVTDPYLTNLSNFGGWGGRSIVSDTLKAYCGTTCGLISGGSIDKVVTGVLQPNTKYRIRAMVKAASTSARIGMWGWSSTKPEINTYATVVGSWAPIDFSFTTEATLGSTQGIFFNNSSGSYIDNWEMYAVPKVYASPSSLTFFGPGSKKIAVRGVSLSNNITITAPTGYSVSPSTLLANVAGDSVTVTFSSANSASGYIYFTSGSVKDSLQVTGTVAPTILAAPTGLTFDDLNASSSFTVTGGNLVSDITITAPTGITVNPTTIPAGSATNVTVSVTYNGTTSNVNGNITLTSGSATANVAVAAIKNSDCLTPLYPSATNIVPDAYLNDLTPFFGWGSKSINTDPAYVYCGLRSGKISGSGSIDIHFPALKSNTRYKMKAMVMTIGGTFRFGISDLGAGVANVDSVFNTNGAWKAQTVEFTTGGGATSTSLWFNNWALNGTTGYIDNWEFYEVPSWNGTGTWSTAANWGGSVPAGADICVVSGTLTIDQNVNVSNVTVYPGAKLTLNSGNTLTVTGNFTISSDATGTGTFVDLNATGGLTVSGATNVQQYLTGAGSATPNGRFWYVSTPVTGANSGVFSASGGNKLWYYAEPAHAYTEITDDVTTLNVGSGYVTRLGVNGTVTFTGGSLNTGPITLSPSRTVDGNAKRGFNLIGNPYPSFLNWDAAGKTNMLSSIWYRALSTGNAMVFDAYNTNTGLGTNANGYAAVTQYIPPMQTVWVKVDADGNAGSVTFDNGMRSHQSGAGTYLRSAAGNVQQVVRLRVSNGNNGDEAVIAFNENATDAFDQYDSPKMSNNIDSIPEIYTLAGSEQVAINGMHSIIDGKELALGFKTDVSNLFFIKATEISNLGTGIRVILKDNLLNTTQDLTDGGQYSFTSDVTGSTNRFSVALTSSIATGVNNDTVGQSVFIYKNANGQIVVYINDKAEMSGMVEIFGALGQKLFSEQLYNTTTVLNNHLCCGVYLVSVKVDGKQTTRKIVID